MGHTVLAVCRHLAEPREHEEKPRRPLRRLLKLACWLAFTKAMQRDNVTRFVPMSERVNTMLRARSESRKEGWVFPSSRSKSGHLTTIAKGFQAAVIGLGIFEPTEVLVFDPNLT